MVDTALAWIRVRRLVSSAGSSHVIPEGEHVSIVSDSGLRMVNLPNQPIPKKELKANNMTTAVMPKRSSSTGAPVSGSGVPVEMVPASTAIDIDMPMAPKNMRARRPKRSIAGMESRDARKYSVPLQAEMRRERLGSKPREFSKM
jgi:hypothetical protein